MAISRWLLLPDQSLSLVNKIDTPTFYQTLSGVTHLEEGEIVELEKRFWALAAKNKDKSNRIDINSLRQLVTPPMPSTLTTAFFKALDENQDGHIDFKELCCGVSAACRGPDLERQKCKKRIKYFLFEGYNRNFSVYYLSSSLNLSFLLNFLQFASKYLMLIETEF